MERVILAVAGGKGGVGKSTVALNVADALSAVVVDADLAMADLPGGRGPDLHDVLAGRASALEAVRSVAGVRVLSCGRTLAGARASDVRRLRPALRAVEREFGAVVVDCPAGMAADAGVAVAVADRVGVVCEPTAFAVPAAVRTRALARELDAGLAGVVVNRAPADLDVARFSRALGAPAVAVPDSDAVASAQARGRPVARDAPDAPAVDAFGSVARTLADGATDGRARPEG
ncbi:P-loop NTPase [Halorubellus sp. PRR65]|uniref:P-loop NTPase n=1 Tax=Halorubellus sp. PRR65 TaxID=3098148 RepID=UPI002B25A178|nr:P-loop NTPase [Halorubellus sp. PRR65]